MTERIEVVKYGAGLGQLDSREGEEKAVLFALLEFMKLKIIRVVDEHGHTITFEIERD